MRRTLWAARPRTAPDVLTRTYSTYDEISGIFAGDDGHFGAFLVALFAPVFETIIDHLFD
jgi:hypothetical protein